MATVKERIIKTVKDVFPHTLKTAWWLVKLTAITSFIILLLRYFGIIDFLSSALSPVFTIVGLPGEAALAYVSGYFINVYSAIAVMGSLNLDARAITILSVMVLCSHNIITETAVQKKTGSSAIRIICIRTLSAIILGIVLNLIMPGKAEISIYKIEAEQLVFSEMFVTWLISTIKLACKMSLIVIVLTIAQSLLSEFGIIQYISKYLKPLMTFFGLPASTAFLWIIANTLGLAYGAAVMIEESEKGTLSKKDIDLLNHHACISHSNLEDTILLVAVGAYFWWLLLSRWAMSLILVWERRLELMIISRIRGRGRLQPQQ